MLEVVKEGSEENLTVYNRCLLAVRNFLFLPSESTRPRSRPLMKAPWRGLPKCQGGPCSVKSWARDVVSLWPHRRASPDLSFSIPRVEDNAGPNTSFVESSQRDDTVGKAPRAVSSTQALMRASSSCSPRIQSERPVLTGSQPSSHPHTR